MTENRKRVLPKTTIDPLPFLEYFVQGEEAITLASAIIGGYYGMIATLDYHTVNREYAKGIAIKFGLPEYIPNHPEISIEETKAILDRSISESALAYLDSRKFPRELVSKYGITSWKWEPHEYNTWAKYFPFNKEELELATFKLNRLEIPCDMVKAETLVIPSYDRNGVLNNLVFRFIDQDIESICAKWLFSHGRQATFGLEKLDPSKPVYIVEGFFDYVAMSEMGYQVVGLGSAFISDAHWKFLEGLEVVFLLDSDDVGYRYSEELKRQGNQVKFLENSHKDPYEHWIATASLRISDI